MKRPSPSRALLVGLILLGVFVLVDIGLFGMLIFRSLSQREINRIILETRAEAEELAGRIATDAEKWNQDLFTAVATNAEYTTYLDQVLAKREIVQMVRILDRDQVVVFESTNVETFGEDPPPPSPAGPIPQVVTEQVSRETPYEVVEVPVGGIGTFVIGLRREEIEGRLEVFRAELIRQAGLIGGLSLALFGAAYLFIVVLIRRSQRFEEQAKDAERLAYVGTLASGLAHEIRSPLNSLNLNMQMLEEDLGPDQGGSKGRLLQITRSEISRLERLVSDFLRYARPRALELEEVSAVSLLERVREMLQGRLRSAGAELEVEDRSRGARVRVDREQIHQLLLNLTENALQATRETSRPARVRLIVDQRPERVVLAVEDNGEGMAPEDIARASEVFYSKRKGGTGLGLAIAERIAKSHDGLLHIESTRGEGTRVEVELPAA
jgi:signal transduction histidine kinase